MLLLHTTKFLSPVINVGNSNSIAQSRSLPEGYVFCAKLTLMLAEGVSFNTIKRRRRPVPRP
jgi:hypothetical protein